MKKNGLMNGMRIRNSKMIIINKEKKALKDFYNKFKQETPEILRFKEKLALEIPFTLN